MPKKNGREALREIKSDPEFRRIPVIALTTSREREDIARCYEMGANSFICKPTSYSELVMIADAASLYWIETVALAERELLGTGWN